MSYTSIPKCQSYHVWFLRYGAQWTYLFVILDHFLSFHPTHNPENQNFEKMKKQKLGDIIILHMCIINNNQHDVGLLRYGVQQTEFFAILDHFLLFYLPNNLKNQNFEKMKNMPGDIIALRMCTINNNHMIYGS